MPNVVSAKTPVLDSHRLLAALRGFRKGDFSVRLPVGLSGTDGEIALRLGDNEPFGLINVGDPTELCKLCDDYGQVDLGHLGVKNCKHDARPAAEVTR